VRYGVRECKTESFKSISDTTCGTRVTFSSLYIKRGRSTAYVILCQHLSAKCDPEVPEVRGMPSGGAPRAQRGREGPR
jgi:hypothetical protein